MKLPIGEKNEVGEEEKIRIKEKIKEILEKSKFVEFAFLHGSFVERKYFNDIDIAIWVKKEKKRDIEKLEEELDYVIDFPIDLKILNSAPPLFKYLVFTKGKLIVCKNEARVLEEKRRALSEYFDFLPLKRRFEREFLWKKLG